MINIDPIDENFDCDNIVIDKLELLTKRIISIFNIFWLDYFFIKVNIINIIIIININNGQLQIYVRMHLTFLHIANKWHFDM